jgi:hypothetical protein
MFRYLTIATWAPKGPNLEATTDLTTRAEVLSYSRARSLFAGVSFEGTSVRPDDGATGIRVWPQAGRARGRRREPHGDRGCRGGPSVRGRAPEERAPQPDQAGDSVNA